MFECVPCGKSFSRKNNLLRHVQVHRGISYLCDICAKVFPRKDTLTRHIRNIHRVLNKHVHQIQIIPVGNVSGTRAGTAAHTDSRDDQENSDQEIHQSQAFTIPSLKYGSDNTSEA